MDSASSAAALSLFPSITWKRCRKSCCMVLMSLSSDKLFYQLLQYCFAPKNQQMNSNGTQMPVATDYSAPWFLWSFGSCRNEERGPSNLQKILSQSVALPIDAVLYLRVHPPCIAINCVKGQLKNWKHRTKEHP